MFLDSSCYRIGQADLEFLLSSPATVGHCPDSLGMDSIRHKGEEVATGYWGEGRGVWGHAVIFAGDRRLKVMKGGHGELPRSRIRMVEGCTGTFCFKIFPSALLGCQPSHHPTSTGPTSRAPRPGRLVPYILASQNSQWLSQPHRIVYANTPPKPKPLGRAAVAHWNVQEPGLVWHKRVLFS